MTGYSQLEKKLGYAFRDPQWLQQALTHPSYTAENCRVTYDNQRLEFLGDAVLQLALSDFLFAAHPGACEGNLSKMRSLLACEAGLVQLARQLDLGRFIRLGKGDQKSNGHQRDSTLADAMEAIFGAIYLDGGFMIALNTIQALYRDLIANLEILTEQSNPKGTLQEISQERFKEIPRYAVLAITGPDHQPEYRVAVSIANREMAIGVAGNRREAEQQAARATLRILDQTPANQKGESK